MLIAAAIDFLRLFAAFYRLLMLPPAPCYAIFFTLIRLLRADDADAAAVIATLLRHTFSPYAMMPRVRRCLYAAAIAAFAAIIFRCRLRFRRFHA